MAGLPQNRRKAHLGQKDKPATKKRRARERRAAERAQRKAYREMSA